jgi:hypothetical protein
MQPSFIRMLHVFGFTKILSSKCEAYNRVLDVAEGTVPCFLVAE